MIEQVHYYPKGAAKALFHSREPELLIEGPAGTGKTRAVLEYVNDLCWTFPRIRVLIVRQTLKSLRESVQKTYEEEVLMPDDADTDAILGNESRDHRVSYDYPNGSHIALGGLDKPERTFSTEYDIVCVFEGIETSKDSWEKLGRCNRNNRMPWQQRILDTNPGPEAHWINQHWPKNTQSEAIVSWRGRKVETGPKARLLSRHEDNPSITPEYLDKLRNLSGANRGRLYEGLWISAEGQIWECFDATRHIIDGDLEQDDAGQWWIRRYGSTVRDIQLRWFGASVDWGHRNPGVLQVWGVDGDNTSYLVQEWYYTSKLIDWWAEKFKEAYDRFRIKVCVCDPSRPDAIQAFNKQIGYLGKRGVPGVAREAVNRHHAGKDMGGLDLVRYQLESGGLYFLRGALVTPDEILVEALSPTRTVEEIPSYIWAEVKDGQAVKEEPKPDLADHGCDALRYWCEEAWGKDRAIKPVKPAFEHGTFGYHLKHEEAMRQARLRRLGLLEDE